MKTLVIGFALLLSLSGSAFAQDSDADGMPPNFAAAGGQATGGDTNGGAGETGSGVEQTSGGDTAQRDTKLATAPEEHPSPDVEVHLGAPGTTTLPDGQTIERTLEGDQMVATLQRVARGEDGVRRQRRYQLYRGPKGRRAGQVIIRELQSFDVLKGDILRTMHREIAREREARKWHVRYAHRVAMNEIGRVEREGNARDDAQDTRMGNLEKKVGQISPFWQFIIIGGFVGCVLIGLGLLLHKSK